MEKSKGERGALGLVHLGASPIRHPGLDPGFLPVSWCTIILSPYFRFSGYLSYIY